MPRKKTDDAPKPRKTVVRQRKGAIDPRKLDDELAHAERFIQKIDFDIANLTRIKADSVRRLGQVKALLDYAGTLDITTEEE